jgi:hypothetical protein
VLLVHDAWGLDVEIEALAAGLASAGFHVLAPDLMGGRRAADAEQARALAVGLDAEDAVRLLASAVDELSGDKVVRPGSIGAVGIGMGALLATTIATLRPEVRLVVAVGPVPDLPLEAWARADADLVVVEPGGAAADDRAAAPGGAPADDDGAVETAAALDMARAAGRRVDVLEVPADQVEATVLATLSTRLAPGPR